MFFIENWWYLIPIATIGYFKWKYDNDQEKKNKKKDLTE